jgi:hypothetical protein
VRQHFLELRRFVANNEYHRQEYGKKCHVKKLLENAAAAEARAENLVILMAMAAGPEKLCASRAVIGRRPGWPEKHPLVFSAV